MGRKNLRSTRSKDFDHGTRRREKRQPNSKERSEQRNETKNQTHGMDPSKDGDGDDRK